VARHHIAVEALVERHVCQVSLPEQRPGPRSNSWQNVRQELQRIIGTHHGYAEIIPVNDQQKKALHQGPFLERNQRGFSNRCASEELFERTDKIPPVHLPILFYRLFAWATGSVGKSLTIFTMYPITGQNGPLAGMAWAVAGPGLVLKRLLSLGY
jgi:hypothetical protein